MVRKRAEDPVMGAIREHMAASGLTYQVLGEKMGYPPHQARQAVYQLLQVADPRVGTLRRFAKAMGVSLGRLLKE